MTTQTAVQTAPVPPSQWQLFAATFFRNKGAVHGFFTRDYPIVQNGILLVATALMLVSLLVDILYGVINPRIRHAS